jgi:hypothetical protein
MKLLNASQLSREVGVSRQAIAKAIKSGALKYSKDKLIDLDCATTKKYLKTAGKSGRGKKKTENKAEELKKILHPDEREKIDSLAKTAPQLIDPLLKSAKEQLKKQQPKKQKRSPAAATAAEETDYPGYGENGSEDRGEDYQGDAFDKIRLECEKKRFEIQKLQIDNDKKRGELIDRKLVRVIFSKIYNIDANQFLQLKDVLTSKISSILGVDDSKKKMKITSVIDKELYKTQNYIKREIDEFIDEIQKTGMVEEPAE